MLARETAREILSHNVGFANPDRWIDYAIRKGFKPVPARALQACLDCAEPSRRVVGEYVHYSNLIRLRECAKCGLIWSDVELVSRVVEEDLDQTYHGDRRTDYFSSRRTPTFEHLASLIRRAAPENGRVLDVGGAHGHLMHLVRQGRPDLATWVHDISRRATQRAAELFGLPTICGPTAALKSCGTFDVIVLSDVLYYEFDLAGFWAMLPTMLAAGSTIIIRVPNKAGLIRAMGWLERVRGRLTGHLPDRLPFFNPAHACVFTRPYLMRRLAAVGFTNVQALAAPWLGFGYRRLDNAFRGLFRVMERAGRVLEGRPILTPSMVLTGQWQGAASP